MTDKNLLEIYYRGFRDELDSKFDSRKVNNNLDGKTKYLGLFDNEEDANKKYLETLKDL